MEKRILSKDLSRRQLHRRLGLALLLMVLTAAAFANAAHDTFINDDKFFAPHDVPISFDSVAKLFSENAWASSGIGSDLYRPLLILSFSLEGLLHGGQARWLHLSNIALHVAATLVLFRLLLALLGEGTSALLAAFLAALIFGIHPVHTEVVNSVFNRSEIFATLGVLGATWVVLRWVDTHPWRAFAGAALLYLSALLFRESAAPLPILVLLVLAFARPNLVFVRAGWRNLLPALSLFVVALFYLWLRNSALASQPPLSVSLPIPVVGLRTEDSYFLTQLGMVLKMLREGLRLLIFPHPLHAIYHTLGKAGALHALALHGIVLFAALWAWRTDPGLLLGLAYFYIALLPSSRILTGSASVAMAERYMYLPSVGLSLGLAYLFAQWLNTPRGKWLVCAAVAGVAVLFFSWTVSRNKDWRSEVALWEAEVRATPLASESWQLLVSAYVSANRHPDAVQICDKKLGLHPQDARLQTSCGIAYDNFNRLRDAESCYKRAIELGLGAPAYANLARFYHRLGRREDAERAYLEAIKHEPNPAYKHYRQGQFLLRFYHERSAEAEIEFRRALELQPRFAPARAALEGLGR